MYSAYVYVLIGNNYDEDKTVLLIADNDKDAADKIDVYRYSPYNYKNIILDNKFEVDKVLISGYCFGGK